MTVILIRTCYPFGKLLWLLFSLLVLTFFLPLHPARAQGVLRLRVGAYNLDLSAVDPRIFHLLAYPVGQAPPVRSPFVVETAPWRGVKRGRYQRWQILKTTGGRLAVDPAGVFDVKNIHGAGVILGGRIFFNSRSIRVSFGHAAGKRLYGSGNARMNESGGLVHTFGTSIVSNGATRIPFVWSTGGYGVLAANNTANISWQDNGSLQTWSVPAPYLDLYLLVAPDPYSLLDTYSRLTGRAPIPPRWTFGYLQSRWGYSDSRDVQSKWQQFRDLRLPVDAFIYDYDWYTNDWEFNPRTFPHPREDLARMSELGIHFVGIRKPRVYGSHYDYARNRGWILTGHDLRLDLPEVRDWWWSQHLPLVQDGVSGWWNDEAEQSYDEFFYMAKAEWDGWRAADPRRAWSLNRAFTPGMQRLGTAVWTGDISSSWSTLRNQPGALLNFGLCGIPYSGQDIGGFNGLPSPELYVRWMQEGVFVPVMRAHGAQNSPRWPWAFGQEALNAVRKAIELRYRLIPYIYSYADVAMRTGAPIIRPLFLEFPRDSRTYNLESEWMVGRELLAAPILAEGGRREVYLPRGLWYDFNSGLALRGPTRLELNASLDTIPTYIKAGSILPMGPVLQYTGQGPEDPLEVRVYPGADGRFVLYEDNGENYDYSRGAFTRIPFRWDNRKKLLWVGQRVGSYPGMLAVRRFHIVLPNGFARNMEYRGAARRVQF